MPQRSYVLQILAEFQDKASAGLAGLGKTLGGVGAVAGGTAVAGIAAAAAAVGVLAASSVASNAEFEQFETRMTTLLHSANEAQTRMAELAEFGKNTPFDLPGVVEADTVLQGFGLHSAEAAQQFGYSGAQIRTIAGDVASGAGVAFKNMTVLLGRFSKGATGEAMSRFEELGITSRAELAKMGLAFSKSGELLSPLPQAMNTVLGLMKEKFGGLMDAQSQTFNGMLSNLRDWASQTTREMGRPFFDAAKAGLRGLLDYLNSPAVTGEIQSLSRGISDFVTGMVDGRRVVGDTLRDIGLAANVSELIAPLKEGLSTLLTTLNGGRAFVVDWGNEARSLAVELGSLFIQVNDGIQKTNILLRESGEVVDSVKNLVGMGLAAAWNLVTAEALGAYHAMMAASAMVRGDVVAAYREFQAATGTIGGFQAALSSLKAVGSSALQQLRDDAETLRRKLDAVSAASAVAQARLRNNMGRSALAGIDDSDLAAEKRDMRLLRGQTAVANEVKQVWAAAGDGAADAWEKAFDQAASYIESALSNAQNSLKGLAPADFFGDMFAPGANGPFENIFRALDVAVRGEDSPWAAALGLDQATAKQIVEKFNAGIMDAQVTALIDIPQLVDKAKLAAAAEQSKKVFVAEVAKLAGVAPTAVGALLGVGPAGTSTQVGDSVTTLAAGVKTAFDGQSSTFEEIGKTLLKKIGEGLDGMKDAFLNNLTTGLIDPMVREFDRATSAVERLIDALTRLGRLPASPPAVPPGGNTPPQRGRVYAPVGAFQPVRVTQNFYGPADRLVVQKAARDGIDEMRRARGYR